MGAPALSLPTSAQDTVSDLQLIVAINAVLVFLLGAARALLYEIEPGRPQHLLWQSLYAVLVILFGQDFPDESADVVEQARRCACPLCTVQSSGVPCSAKCSMFYGFWLCLLPHACMSVVAWDCSLVVEGIPDPDLSYISTIAVGDHPDELACDGVRCRPLR